MTKEKAKLRKGSDMDTLDKIYLSRNALGVLHDSWSERPIEVFDNIEYICKDAFIKKASEWIEENIEKWYENIKVHGFKGMTPLMIVEFKKYMKRG